jgi:hypothetical protein
MKTIKINSLEVFPSDLGEMSWVEANHACKALADDGGGWRLPTIEELKEMYNISEMYNKEQDLNFSTGYYWAENQTDINTIEDGAAVLFVAPYIHDDLPGYYRNFNKVDVYKVRPVRSIA